MKTWQIEFAVVALIQVMTAIVSRRGGIEWVAVAAVIITFCYVQIADRHAEQDAARAKPGVHCAVWSRRYLVGKEVLWVTYFAARGAYPAIVGALLFLAYPFWRRLWRRMHPLSAQPTA